MFYLAMGIDNEEEEKDERLPYLPGLGQGEKLAEDEELVADLSSMFRHTKRFKFQLISYSLQHTSFFIMLA